MCSTSKASQTLCACTAAVLHTHNHHHHHNHFQSDSVVDSMGCVLALRVWRSTIIFFVFVVEKKIKFFVRSLLRNSKTESKQQLLCSGLTAICFWVYFCTFSLSHWRLMKDEWMNIDIELSQCFAMAIGLEIRVNWIRLELKMEVDFVRFLAKTQKYETQ